MTAGGREPLWLGLDIGTSGCRAVVIDAAARQVAQSSASLPPPLSRGDECEQDPQLWWQAVTTVLHDLCTQVDCARIHRLAVDGTSATLLLTDTAGTPLGPALMYNDARSRDAAQRIGRIAPADSGAHGASSALAKLIQLTAPRPQHARHALHQADWIAGRLAGHFGLSDENNCLKLGYDPQRRAWPAWIAELGIDMTLLPQVAVPGTPIATLAPALARQFGFRPDTEVAAGTTDGVASFLATGAAACGDAVTSLGSTLVLKVLSDRAVFAPRYGVYSHRLGNRWLVGGASNCGGTTLLQFFSREAMTAMEPRLRPDEPTGLDYYPLPACGERFPVNDPDKAPRLSPRPADDHVFFQALLEGIAAVEKQGYDLLAKLGAPYPATLRTTGGGAGNEAWSRIRQRCLGVTLLPATGLEAAFGTALLARGAAATAA